MGFERADFALTACGRVDHRLCFTVRDGDGFLN
jgi:hypothetical protein